MEKMQLAIELETEKQGCHSSRRREEEEKEREERREKRRRGDSRKIHGWAQQKRIAHDFNVVSSECGWAQQQKQVHLEFLMLQFKEGELPVFQKRWCFSLYNDYTNYITIKIYL